jgi:hypothetical protein
MPCSSVLYVFSVSQNEGNLTLTPYRDFLNDFAHQRRVRLGLRLRGAQQPKDGVFRFLVIVAERVFFRRKLEDEVLCLISVRRFLPHRKLKLVLQSGNLERELVRPACAACDWDRGRYQLVQLILRVFQQYGIRNGCANVVRV